MKLDYLKHPLSAEGEERVAHEVPRGESSPLGIKRASWTHPVFASLDHPLFATRKEDEKFLTSLIIASQTTKIRTVNEA
jgi:hypothetical protein